MSDVIPPEWVKDIDSSLFPIPHATQQQKLIARLEKQGFVRFQVFVACMLGVFLLFLVSQVA
jgi:hypothetical protein